MSDLKPCKNCGGKCDPEGWMSQTKDGEYHKGPACDDCGTSAPTVEAWEKIMSDTPALRYVRMGLEMAAKKADNYLKPVEFPTDAASILLATAQPLPVAIRSITDADIMKEISREE